MKKNKMMRLASALLVAVLVTTCGISGTFAKYVAKGEKLDKAQVAKWGVTVTVATDEAFSNVYAKTDSNTEIDPTVEAAGSYDLVAPGTNGKIAGVTIAGTPEVAVRVKYTVDKLELTNWTTDGTTEYCPIIFTVDGKTYATDDTSFDVDYSYETVALLIDAVTTAIETKSAEYEPNATLEDEDFNALNFSWNWPFHVSDALDAKDTILGNNADENPAKIDFKISVVAEQID